MAHSEDLEGRNNYDMKSIWPESNKPGEPPGLQASRGMGQFCSKEY